MIVQTNDTLKQLVSMISQGDLQILSKYVNKKKIDLIYQNNLYKSSFLYICTLISKQKESLVMLKYLINHGLNPKEVKQDTSLAQFAIKMDSLAILQFLIETNYFGIDYLNYKNQSFLHLAILYNSSKIINYLIAQKVDVNQKDDNGSTPLHYAVQTSNLSLIKTLIHKGANPQILDDNRLTVLDLAIKLKYPKIIDYLNRREQRQQNYILVHLGNKVTVKSITNNPQLSHLLKLKNSKNKFQIKKTDNWRFNDIAILNQALLSPYHYVFQSEIYRLYSKLFTNSFKKKQSYAKQRNKLLRKYHKSCQNYPIIQDLLKKIYNIKE